jgi:hypothetical protein
LNPYPNRAEAANEGRKGPTRREGGDLMKKWYAGVGVLVVALAISLGTCAVTETQVREGLEAKESELRDTESQLTEIEGELSDTEVELQTARSNLAGIESQLIEGEQQLADREAELEEVRADLAQLKATKELVFGKGLRIFDIEYSSEFFTSFVKGRVQNTSSEPMKTVGILTVSWNEDGSLYDTEIETVYDLFPQEIADWQSWVYEEGKELGIYAFGNR